MDIAAHLRKRGITLTPSQLQGLSPDPRPTLLLAVPGSGKTTVLVARAAALSSAGIPAEKVLNLTFSRAPLPTWSRRFSELFGGFSQNLPAFHRPQLLLHPPPGIQPPDRSPSSHPHRQRRRPLFLLPCSAGRPGSSPTLSWTKKPWRNWKALWVTPKTAFSPRRRSPWALLLPSRRSGHGTKRKSGRKSSWTMMICPFSPFRS